MYNQDVYRILRWGEGGPGGNLIGWKILDNQNSIPFGADTLQDSPNGLRDGENNL